MMYEMRRRKIEPTRLLTRGILSYTQHGNYTQHCKIYTAWKWITAQLNVIAVTGFVPLSPGSPTQRLNQMSYLPTPLKE